MILAPFWSAWNRSDTEIPQVRLQSAKFEEFFINFLENDIFLYHLNNWRKHES